MTTGSNTDDLDFASVQRGNPEIQRRAQEVIDRCWQMGARRATARARRRQSDPLDPRRGRRRPLQRPAGTGPRRRLRRPLRTARRAQRGAGHVARSKSGATRRRSATCWPSRRSGCRSSATCASASAVPFAVVGAATDDGRLVVGDRHFGNNAGGHGHGSAARQAAAHDARRVQPRQVDLPPFDVDRARPARGRLSRAAPARRSPRRTSSSPSATAASAASRRATRWSGRGRCRSPTWR